MKEKFTIFIIYQGDESSNHYDEMLKLFKRLNDKHNIVVYKASERGSSFDDTIHLNIQKSIETCDFAIAIIDVDKRNTIEAGNLWFEIGWFIGKRNKTDLFIFKNMEIKNIISDISNDRIQPGFNEVIDLEGKILSLIGDERLSRQSNSLNRPDSKDKIQIIFNSKHNKQKVWLNNDSYVCHLDYILDKKPCSSKLNHLLLSSEIINVSIEIEILQCFKQFITDLEILYGRLFQFNDELKKDELNPVFASLYISARTEFKNNCSLFFVKVKSLFSKGGYKYPDKPNPIESINEFIYNRLIFNDKKMNPLITKNFIEQINFHSEFFIDTELDEKTRLDFIQKLYTLNNYGISIKANLLKVEEILSKSFEHFLQGVQKNGHKTSEIHEVVPEIEKKLPYNNSTYFNIWEEKYKLNKN